MKQHGLALLVFAEWYNLDSMAHMRFFDDNTRSWWTPITGGGNVPALNDLLKPFDAAFGSVIVQGGLKVASWDLQVRGAGGRGELVPIAYCACCAYHNCS